MNSPKPASVDDYIASFPIEVQDALNQVRATIKQSAPEAEETISYAMPAYKLHGMLVYFAAFKNHIGLYALPSGNEAFKDALTAYKTGKGSIQFPLNKPLPLNLIAQIVKFRISENQTKVERKRK